MTTEIRLRLNAECKSTFQKAADRHGVPLVHFITMAVHGYLRGIGDLTAVSAPSAVATKPKANAFPDTDMSVWLEEDDD